MRRATRLKVVPERLVRAILNNPDKQIEYECFHLVLWLSVALRMPSRF